MSTLKKLTCLTLAFSIAACNEKVSPELQGAASSTTTGGNDESTVVQPDEFYFRLKNTADTMLNYKLHKTGPGNANVACEITNKTGFSSDEFRTNPEFYDITCFLEAEELVLGYNGLQYTIEASPNTCQFIGYQPFSFYNFQPGNSTQTIHKLTCNNNASVAMARAEFPEIANDECDTYRSLTAAQDFVPEKEKDFCAFDHSTNNAFEGAPNCDDGVLTFIDYMAIGLDTNNDGVVDSAKVVKTPRTLKCDGKPVNCIDGPIKQETELAKFTSGIVMSRTTTNQKYSKQYSLPKLIGSWPTNRKYVNFRRDLASTEIEYGNSDRSFNDGSKDPSVTLSSAYMSSFGDPINASKYEPEVMSMYANNKRMDGSTLVTSTMLANHQFDYLKGPGTRGTAYAAEPFLGFGDYKTNPFYGFYCFDNAYDIKARIRMVVREWDRTLPLSDSSYLYERISDIDLLPPQARQDVPYTLEVTGDPDSWNDFNDLYDWDDLIDMERVDSGVPYDPSITIYRPYPTADFPDGFLNPKIFPMELLPR